jgi:shikimate dehydrogenase
MELFKRRYKLGLIGYPLGHTFSPDYFTKKFKELGLFDSEYLAYPIESIELVDEICRSGIDGINVTIPYKEQVIPFLDELSEEAYDIGAVNTIRIRDGRRTGYNTDTYGFEWSLKNFLRVNPVKSALVLGTGGASKAVKYVLKNMGISITVVSRNNDHMTYADIDADIIERNELIVNTTPLGMSPNINECPDLPYSFLSEKHFLYDLIYNPEKTLFLKKGELQGCSVKNGYEMLVLQAEKSWEIWNQQ